MSDNEDEDEPHDPDSGNFKKGALVRVKLTNFVTYENAEFFPGPSLNMVIGPNGTGKSSLVCAICLGLGWGPGILGRASQIGEFVKHGQAEAQVEIELQKKPNEPYNHVIRLKIIRDGNSREWYLDGKKTSLNAIRALMEHYRIQVDNLCQFLPQDKVSEFAAMDDAQKLVQTQRAVAEPQMTDWHNLLIKWRKEQQLLDRESTSDKEHLATIETRQQGLHAEVQKLQERQQIQERIEILNYTIPFVEYNTALAQHRLFKEKKQQAQKRYAELKATVDPTLQSIHEKKDYASRIEAVIKQRKSALTAAEQDAQQKTTEIEGLDGEIKTNEQGVEAAYRENNFRKKEIQGIQRKIADMRARQNGEPVVFDGPEWNERIRAKEHEARDVKSELDDCETRNRELVQRGRAIQEQRDEAKQQLGAFDTQEGRQLNKLEHMSKDTAAAWKWVQDNMDSFEMEVYPPPMISCSVKDPRYVNAVESMLQKPDFLCITAQTANDHTKLSNQLHGVMGLKEVTIRSSVDHDLDALRRLAPISAEEMQEIGMDGWAVDYIDGPLPVQCMLSDSGKLHLAAITLQEISDSQYQTIIARERLNRWTTASERYQISRRREYGPLAATTTTRPILPAKWWVDQPIDTSARRELDEKVKALDQEIEHMKTQIVKPLRGKIADLSRRSKEIGKEISEIKKQKADLQTEYGKWKALPDKIRVEETALESKKEANAEFVNHVKKLQNQHDLAVIRKSKYALEYKTLVEKIRDCHDDLLEAQVRHIEAQSDVEGLTARNEDIVRELEAEEARKNNAELEAKRVQAVAKKALELVKTIMAHEDYKSFEEEVTNYPDGTTVETLRADIAAEESKLEYMQLNNPNALKQYEKLQGDVDQLKEKINATEGRLEKLESRITKIRDRWEPELDRFINEISDAFSYNFEQIGCAGSVSVNKDEDFAKWKIEIKVKFRKGEDLQILDAHRQSGGERSVSTIFYLMALQSMAKSPFRVVDEINQGMDPRNERMVHERMVEIACKEHTSQYFLITPKLLTGLRYDKRMKVLCIASGEHMPENYKKLDISKIIGIRRAIMANA